MCVKENPKRLNQSRESEMYETLEITCCAPNPTRYRGWFSSVSVSNCYTFKCVSNVEGNFINSF